MEGARTLPDSVQIVVPDGWDDIRLDPASRATFLSSLRERSELSRGELRQVELALAQLGALVAQYRVVLSSGMVARLEETGSDEPQVVMAGMAASVISRQDLDTAVPLLPDVLIKVFAGRGSDGEVAFDEIEPPAKVELAGTTAVRLVRLVRPRSADTAALKQFTQSYLVPVAMGDGLIALHFSTINLEYARQFSELFEKIAGTLRILYPDDPTFLDDEDTQVS